jgi:hypothetical protein
MLSPLPESGSQDLLDLSDAPSALSEVNRMRDNYLAHLTNLIFSNRMINSCQALL